MVDECGVHVRLMTMGRMSTIVLGQCRRMALARGCICRGLVDMCGRGYGPCYFHSLIQIFLIEEYRRRPFV
jgi:hypothetical protein